MKTTILKSRILILMLTIFLLVGAVSAVFAEANMPTISFTSSGAIYDEGTRLLRFNFDWSADDNNSITVMYSIDNGEEKELGVYADGENQVIAHIYLSEEESAGSVITIYAIDSRNVKSEGQSVRFKPEAIPGEEILDTPVPLSTSEGTWSLINLFLTLLASLMCAVSVMLYIENRTMESFIMKSKIKSRFIMIVSILSAAGNIIILMRTQELKQQMVMFDNMTVTMLLITVLSVVMTMTLAARAYRVISERELMKNS